MWCVRHCLASHPVAASISVNTPYCFFGDVDPYQLSLKSTEEISFTCQSESCRGLEDHHFTAVIRDVVNGVTQCPFCSTLPREMCFDRHCEMCYPNRFYSFSACGYIHYKTSELSIDLMQIFKTSAQLLGFKCSRKHKFKDTPDNVTRNNSWCPECKKHTAEKLIPELKKFSDQIVCNADFEWPNTKYNFDFYIPDLKVVIDVTSVDCEHPECFNMFSKGSFPGQVVDKRLLCGQISKEVLVNQKGLTMIRLLERDIFQNDEWKEFLGESLELACSSGPCVFEKCYSDTETHWYE